MKDSVILTREYIELIEQLVESKQAEELKQRLAEMHPADIAEMCDDMSIEDARYIYHLLEGEDAADVLIEMDEDARNELLEDLPSETIAKKFVDFMDTDDAVDIIRDMDEDKQEEILAHIEDIDQFSFTMTISVPMIPPAVSSSYFNRSTMSPACSTSSMCERISSCTSSSRSRITSTASSVSM